MSGPRAIAEKGNVLTAALSEVNSFATMRYKMIDETQRNEAITAAKIAIKERETSLARGNDLTVLDGGKNSVFNQEMDAIRAELLETLPNWFKGGSRASKQLFEQEFKIASSNAEFRLDDIFFRKQQERFKVSTKERQDDVVRSLSVLTDAEGADKILGFELANEKKVLERAAANKLVNPVFVETIPGEMREDIAKNLVIDFTFQGNPDEHRPAKLKKVLLAFNNLRANPKDTKAQNQFQSALNDVSEDFGGLYTAQVLLSIPQSEAAKIVTSAIEEGGKAAQAAEKLRKAANREQVNEIERILSFIESRDSDSDQFVTANQINLRQIALDLKVEGTNQTLGQIIENGSTTNTVKKFLTDYLNQNETFLNDSKYTRQLEEALLQDDTSVNFNALDDDQTVATLEFALSNGTLTQKDLNNYTSSLTIETYRGFDRRLREQQSRINNEANTELNRILQLGGYALNIYTKEQDGSQPIEEDARANNAAFNRLKLLILSQIEDGTLDPTNRLELINARDEIIVDLKSELITDIQDSVAVQLNNLLESFLKNPVFSGQDFRTTDFFTAKKTMLQTIQGMTPNLIPGQINTMLARLSNLFKRMPSN